MNIIFIAPKPKLLYLQLFSYYIHGPMKKMRKKYISNNFLNVSTTCIRLKNHSIKILIKMRPLPQSFQRLGRQFVSVASARVHVARAGAPDSSLLLGRSPPLGAPSQLLGPPARPRHPPAAGQEQGHALHYHGAALQGHRRCAALLGHCLLPVTSVLIDCCAVICVRLEFARCLSGCFAVVGG